MQVASYFNDVGAHVVELTPDAGGKSQQQRYEHGQQRNANANHRHDHGAVGHAD